VGTLKDSVDEVRAEQMGRDPRWVRLEDLVREMAHEGHDFSVLDGELRFGNPDRTHEYQAEVLPEGKTSLAIISDTHLGSNYEQLTALREFIDEADDYNDGRGVDAILHAGDMTQGTPKMHRGMEHEVHVRSLEGQVGYSAAVLPHSRHGTPYYVISGNHDDSWTNESGANVIRQIARLRDDVRYIGQDSCYFTMQGDDDVELRTYLVHPDGGQSYAKSYKPQKLTEAIPIDSRTQLAIIGHYHTFGVFEVQKTIAIMQPCFQGQYPWMVRKSLYPTIGGIIVDIEFDDAKVKRFDYSLRKYPELREDYDHVESAKWQRPGDILPEDRGV